LDHNSNNKVLIYLHGFLSSPESVKAQATKEYWLPNHPDIPMICPQLPYYPLEARDLLDEIAMQNQDKQLGFIGSSMGGFFSTYMMDRYGGKGVLINPAAQPHKVLSKYLGEHEHPYTQEKFVLEPHHMHELELMYSAKPKAPEDYWVLLQTEDETLDYRDAERKYQNAKLTIEEGGDHAFQGYERFLPDIYRFLFD
jgi:predicted esterase YcpF (UPF0227 family)